MNPDRPSFDKATAAALEQSFLRLRPGEEDDARLFVKMLAALRGGIPIVEAAQSDQKQRRRSLDELGRAAAKVADIVKTLDVGALGMALDLGEDAEAGALPLLEFKRLVEELRGEIIFRMATLSDGSFRAAKQLPASKFNVRLEVAKAIDAQFLQFGLPDFRSPKFGATAVAYATECLRAVLEVDDPRYWIRQVQR